MIHDYAAETITEEAIADALISLIGDGSDEELGALLEETVDLPVRLADSEFLTADEGLTFRLADGRDVLITIKIQ